MEDLKKELQVIQELMGELSDKMQYGEDDLSNRLGRKKPGIEVVKVEGKMPMGDAPMGDSSPMPGMDPDSDQDMDGDMGAMDMMEESPEDKLKNRLMKLRS